MAIARMGGQQQRGPAPRVYGPDVRVLSYAGIIAAAGGSFTFNIWHASHRGHLQIAMAFIFGFLPPFLATILAHLAAATRVGKWGRAWVFTVTAGAMFVSAYATSQVVAPVSGLGVGVVFSLVADAASMTCLVFLLRYYAAAAEYKAWLAAADPGTVIGAGNHVGAGGSGNQPPDAAAGSRGVVPGTGTRDLDRAVPAPHDGPAGRSGPSCRAPRSAADRPASAGPREPRDAVVAELAARPGPALESTQQLEQRALEFVREFRRRTGQRMNNGEFARALGMRKADAGALRAAIQEREEDAA
ncbi:MAG: hypothetical protein ACRDOL_13195 [Streptosporangiaceae bacterium]